jgi:ribokinase
MAAGENPMRIVVLGSFVQACCWKVARLPKAGETFTASALSIEAGGKGLNVAIGTRRLGADVDVLLGIGQDTAGDGLLRLLEKEGLSSAHVWRLAPQSGYGAGLIAADGQNAIAVYPGPNLLLAAEHVQGAEPAICAADLVYGQLETSLDAVASAFRAARLGGARTVLNPSPWQNLPKSLLDDTDVLIVNEVEARDLLALGSTLSGSLQDCIELLHPLLDSLWLKWQGELLVVTLGAVGSLAFERHGPIHHAPAFEIAAMDSVGAGDAFASGLCIELCKRTPLAEALRYANACGAFMASRFGVLDSLPGQATLQAFFKSVA